MCSIWKWSNEADVKLQDCFASTDWNMFWDSTEGIEDFTTSVTGFINKFVDEVVPQVTVQWITDNIHTELKARAAAGRM